MDHFFTSPIIMSAINVHMGNKNNSTKGIEAMREMITLLTRASVVPPVSSYQFVYQPTHTSAT